MVWGGMCSFDVIPLFRIERTMFKESYHSILCRRAFPGGVKLLGRGFDFQQDNDPKHIAYINKKYLSNKEKKVIKLKILIWGYINDFIGVIVDYSRWSDGLNTAEP